MKTTVNYCNVAYSQKDNVIICDMDFTINPGKIKNFEVFKYYKPIAKYLSKFNIDDDGYVHMHTTGITRCKLIDTYQYETGRKIALTKAQRNAFREAMNFFDGIDTILTKQIFFDLWSTSDNCYDSYCSCNDHRRILGKTK